MLQPLIESDDDIDYDKYWKRTIAYKFFKKQNHLKVGNDN